VNNLSIKDIMAYQFRIPWKELCSNCTEVIKQRQQEYRRLAHRKYMNKYRNKKKAILDSFKVGDLKNPVTKKSIENKLTKEDKWLLKQDAEQHHAENNRGNK